MMLLAELVDLIDFHDAAIVGYSKEENWADLTFEPSEFACEKLGLNFGSTILCHFVDVEKVTIDGTLEFAEGESNEIQRVSMVNGAITFNIQTFNFSSRLRGYVNILIKALKVEVVR